MSKIDGDRHVSVTTLAAHYHYKTSKILNKMQVVCVIIFNFFYFFYRSIITKKRNYDIILLANHTVAIPFLLLIKILPLIRVRGKIIIISFFLHSLGKKKVIQRILRYLLNNKKLILQVQSPYEKRFYSDLTNTAKIVHFPFCRHEVPSSDKFVDGGEYIFAGGYTNRDYKCVLDAAKKINENFIIICSKLNEISFSPEEQSNVNILCETSPEIFYGYLKHSKIVIIPLKEETGSSGQMVALAAMYFKMPTVYTNIDSVSQYFEDGVSGISYRKGDPDDLTEKIRFLLSKPQLCKRMGENAYNRYYERYHVSKYCEFLVELIRS